MHSTFPPPPPAFASFRYLDLRCPSCGGDGSGDTVIPAACGCPDCGDRDRLGCFDCNGTGSLESGCEVCGCVIGADCSAQHDDTRRGYTTVVDGERFDVCSDKCRATFEANERADARAA